MPISMIPLVAALGYAAGAGVNYLADVLPRYRSLTRPHCVHCAEPLSIWQSYIWLGRCPACGLPKGNALRSYAVLVSGIAATLWLYLSPPARLPFLPGFVIMIFFALVVVIDVEHRLILHPVSLAGVGIGFAIGWWLHGLVSTLVGGMVGFGLMFLLFKFGEVFTRIISRMRGELVEEVALGFGDVNLSGVLGLLLGWPVISLGLIIAILAGGLYSLGYLLLSALLGRYRSFEAMPYAPYLILAAALLLFFPGVSRAILAGLSPLMAAAFK